MKAIEIFKPVYFWDCIVEEIDLKDDAEFVIERVLARSLNEDRLNNIDRLKDIYPIDFIKEVARHSTQIFGNNKIEEIAKQIGIEPTEIATYILPNFYRNESSKSPN